MRALLVLAFLFSCHAMGQSVPMEAQAHAGQVLQAHRAWGERMNTKGATLRIKEVSRQGNIIGVQFYAEGLPKKWIYSLMSLPVGSQNASILLTGISLGADGRAICSGRPGECGKKEQPNAPITLRLNPASGEPLRFAIFAKTDQTVRAALNYVPFPLAAADKSCRTEAVALEPNAALLHIEGTGFPANTIVSLNTEAGGKKAQKQLKSDTKGEVMSTLILGRTDKPGTIRVQIAGPTCSPSVDIPWPKQ